MNIEEVREYCLTKKAVIEDFPFDNVTPVMKIANKMFALLNLEEIPSLNLKCEPLKAVELREMFPAIIPGYHMNKKHWNTVILDGSLPRDLVLKMIDESYELVLNSLPEKIRTEIKQLP